MSATTIFGWGIMGSVAVDVITAVRFYEADTIEFPERYRRVFYYVCRMLLAGMAGGLAVAYDIDKPLLAVNIGASAPLILSSLSQGFSNQGTPSAKPIRAPRPAGKV